MRTAAGIQAAWELPYGPLAAARARGALSSWLAGYGIDPADGPGFDIILATSELAANAGVHGLPPVLLDAWLEREGDGWLVTVCVSDEDPRLPGPVASLPLAEHGRGLGIAAAVALHLNVCPAPEGGKAAWLKITVPAPAGAESSGRVPCHDRPFGMNCELSPGPARGEALAS
jgi:hypothetical protein